MYSLLQLIQPYGFAVQRLLQLCLTELGASGIFQLFLVGTGQLGAKNIKRYGIAPIVITWYQLFINAVAVKPTVRSPLLRRSVVCQPEIPL